MSESEFSDHCEAYCCSDGCKAKACMVPVDTFVKIEKDEIAELKASHSEMLTALKKTVEELEFIRDEYAMDIVIDYIKEKIANAELTVNPDKLDYKCPSCGGLLNHCHFDVPGQYCKIERTRGIDR